jgi:hypothetical protein
MRKNRFYLALAAVLAAPMVQAQAPCDPGVTGAPPACMVGAWAGDSDMAARLEAFFATLPEDVRAMVTTPAGQSLFLQVGAAGQYVASPLNQSAEAVFSGDAGSAAMQIDVTTTGSTGRIYAAGADRLSFCAATGMANFTMSGGGMSESGSVPAMGAMGPAPVMRYACGDGTLRIMVDTPPPMGTVTYDLRRIDEAALPAALRGLLPAAP